jgi:uncharacterized membrane protein
MSTIEILALCFGIGVLTGCRSMSAPAAVCWAAHLNWLHLESSPLSFLGSTIAVAIVSVLAVAELVVDKLPVAPDRRETGSLIWRATMGGVCGAALCISASQSPWIGAIIAALGALAGTFGGYQVRHRIVTSGKVPDIAAALLEDLIAVGGDFWIVSRFG